MHILDDVVHQKIDIIKIIITIITIHIIAMERVIKQKLAQYLSSLHQ